jgi:hypothetical protein
MLKYHKDIGFLPSDVIKAESLINRLQGVKLSFSKHSLAELSKEREAVKIGQFLLSYEPKIVDMFELVKEGDFIVKLGFRVKFNQNDIVFMLSQDKTVITVWTNKREDLHYTLDKKNYVII